MEISDELLGAFVPVIAYWLYSGMYVLLAQIPWMDGRRLHPKGEEEKKNIASRSEVVKGVFLQQAVQVAVVLLAFAITGDKDGKREATSWPVTILKFVSAMFILDSWEYMMHRTYHTFPILYKYIHAQHHALVVPYAYGALYNNPIEGLVSETIGGSIAFLATGMTPRMSIYFFTLATIKTVDDHCGFWLPWSPFQYFFANNAPLHDIHHQLYGGKYNFTAPFFLCWDRILGTYMPYTIVERKGGGFESRPVSKKEKQDS